MPVTTFFDRIKETCAAPGVGSFVMGGAVVGGFFTWSTIGNGNVGYYTAQDAAGNVEVGLGTYTAAGNFLSRDTVLRSTNANALVNFTGSVTVWFDAPAYALTNFGSTNQPNTWTAPQTFAPAARSAASSTVWRLESPADTNLTTVTECLVGQLGGNSSTPPTTVTRQWANGTLPAQRQFAVIADTISFVGVASQTVTSCTVLDINGSNPAGTSCTLGTTSFTGTGGTTLTLPNSYAFTIGGPAAPVLSIDGNGLVISKDAGFYTWSSSGHTLGSPANFIKINPNGVGTGATNQDHWFDVWGTFPAAPASSVIGVHFQITGAGSAAANETIMNVQMQAGYTGSGFTVPVKALNSSAGTNTGFGYVGGANAGGGNMGLLGLSQGVTVGYNTAVLGYAQQGNLNVGVGGYGVVNKASATNIGVAGFGLNTASTPIQLGGYFGLHSAYPTFASAALMCDNGSQTSDIFVARDNGTAKISIVDGGNLTFAAAVNVAFDTVTGTKIGTVGGAAGQKIAFWNSIPIVQPVLATGVSATVDNVITVLQNLGLCRQS